MSPDDLRQLDADVHREVFGFSDLRKLPVYTSPDCGTRSVADSDWLDQGIFDTALDWCYLPKYEHDATGDEFCDVVPEYSADIKAAWLVIERMGQWMFDMRWGFDGNLCSGDWQPVHLNASAAGWTVTFGEHTARDASAPLAICRAALKAVRKGE